MSTQDIPAQLISGSCHLCHFWKGRKIGCTSKTGCCSPASQPWQNGDANIDDTKTLLPNSECVGCPYGRDSPCIGWCTKEAMRSVGLLKERDKNDV